MYLKMKLRRFCAKCGKVVDNQYQINNNFLCEDCSGLIRVSYTVPQKIQFRSCVFCNAHSIRNGSIDKEYPWAYKPEDESDLDFVSRLLYEHLFLKIEKKQNLTYELFLPLNFKIVQKGDLEVKIEVSGTDSQKFDEGTMTIKLRRIHCPHCAKREGGGFDCTLQIRIQHESNQDLLHFLATPPYLYVLYDININQTGYQQYFSNSKTCFLY